MEEEATPANPPPPPQPLATIRSQEALLTADAPATERLLTAPPERAFEPHDVRESVLGVLTIEALVELWGLGEKRAADGTVRTTAAEEAEAAANAATAAVAAAPAAAPAQRAAIARRVTTLLRAERIASVLREQRDSERRSSWFTRMSAVRRDGAMG